MELTTLTEYIHVDCITTNLILKPVVLNYIQYYNSIAKLQVVCALFYISVDRVTIILYMLDMLKKKEKKQAKAIRPMRAEGRDFGWSKVKVSGLHLLWFDMKSVKGRKGWRNIN